ncbi:MAG: ABC transporter permease, partial [bacterium]
MLDPRLKKIVRELFSQPSRTVLVILSIAVGVFAVGTIAGAYEITFREMTAEYMKVEPNHFSMGLGKFDYDLVRSIQALPEIKQVEGIYSKNFRFKTKENSDWQNLLVTARLNYDEQKIDIIRPDEGKWKTDKGELLIERKALSLMNNGKGKPIEIGDSIIMELSNGDEREVKIVGTVHDINKFPSPLSRLKYGYISFETLEWLGEERKFTGLLAQVAKDEGNKAHIKEVADKIRETVERGGLKVGSTRLPNPGKHPANDPIAALLALMLALGGLTLILSGFLVTNTISAILTQQIKQIGIMKAVGGNTRQITAIYLLNVFVYGVLAYLVALPLAYWGAMGLSNFLGGLINYDIQSFATGTVVNALKIVVAIVVPLLASLIPISRGTRIKVVDALRTEAGSALKKKGPIDRFLENIRNLPRPMILSLRNTFRQKGRLALSLITLTLGGAIFIGVFSVRASLFATIDQALQYYGYDISLNFKESFAVGRLQKQAMTIPGVVYAESWGGRSVQRVYANNSLSEDITIVAPPPKTTLLDPILMEGRWLETKDRSEVVVNTNLLDNEKDLKLGSSFKVKVNSLEKEVVIVGIVKGVLAQPTIYMSFDYFGRMVEETGKAAQLLIKINSPNPDEQIAVAEALEKHFEKVNMPVVSRQTTNDVRTRIQGQFNIIIV